MCSKQKQLVGMWVFNYQKSILLPAPPQSCFSSCFLKDGVWVSCPITQLACLAEPAAVGHVIWNGQNGCE